MPKVLTVTVTLYDPNVRTPRDAEGLADLFCGISGGGCPGRVEITECAGSPDAPVERYIGDVPNVGVLREFLAGVPDSAEFSSYSGSVESLVGFGISYEADDDGRFGVVVRNDN